VKRLQKLKKYNDQRFCRVRGTVCPTTAGGKVSIKEKPRGEKVWLASQPDSSFIGILAPQARLKNAGGEKV
jgi:hypothetical protein